MTLPDVMQNEKVFICPMLINNDNNWCYISGLSLHFLPQPGWQILVISLPAEHSEIQID